MGKRKKAVIGLGVMVLAIPFVGPLLLRMYYGSLDERLSDWLISIQNMGPFAWLAIATAQTLIAVSGLLPASILGVAAGAIYGVWIGFMLTGVGTMVGAALAFILARSMLRPIIQRKTGHQSYIRRLDKAISKKGWRTVCLLRISPVMPFAMSSYALGLTSISFRPYFFGSLAAMPALLGYVALGKIARHGVVGASEGMHPIKLIVTGVGLIATVLFIFFVGKVIKEAMHLEDDESITMDDE